MRTERKIWIVIFVLFWASVVVTLVLLMLNRQQEAAYREYSRQQTTEAANAIADRHEEDLYWVAHEHATSDDMVAFAARPDTAWAQEHLAGFLFWYDLNGLWILNADGELVYGKSTGCSREPTEDMWSDGVLGLLAEEGLSHFYTLLGGELMLLQGATIVPSHDEDRRSIPQGYLFLSKCWDEDQMKLLEALTGCDVTVHDLREGLSRHETVMPDQLHVTYRDWRGEPLACLVFSRRLDFADILRSHATQMALLLVLMMVFHLVLLMVVMRRWVTRPLDLVAGVISGEREKDLPLLKWAGYEFRQIGELIEHFLEQKQDLLRQKLRAEESDRLKSAFLANVSHEIRTPMSGTIGFAELLRDEHLTPEQRHQYLDVVINSSRHLLRLLDDVMDLSSIESGQLCLNDESFDLELLMLEIQAFFKEDMLVKSKQLSLGLQMDIPEGEGKLVSDRTRLRQVLSNLLDNATKFTARGEIIFGCRKEEPGEWLFFVKDTGPGIPLEYHERIFDRFAQFHPRHERSGNRGTGLGLAIAKGIVGLMKGRIWVESAPGKGAAFYFSIPTSS